MVELVAKSLTQDDPMDSIQVGKTVFVKESYTTLGIEPRTYSNPGRSSNHYSVCWVGFTYILERGTELTEDPVQTRRLACSGSSHKLPTLPLVMAGELEEDTGENLRKTNRDAKWS